MKARLVSEYFIFKLLESHDVIKYLKPKSQKEIDEVIDNMFKTEKLKAENNKDNNLKCIEWIKQHIDFFKNGCFSIVTMKKNNLLLNINNLNKAEKYIETIINKSITFNNDIFGKFFIFFDFNNDDKVIFEINPLNEIDVRYSEKGSYNRNNISTKINSLFL